MELGDASVVAEGLAFPEGPVALPDGSVLVVEMLAGTITRVAANGSRELVADVKGGPNGAAIGPDGALYVCNNGGYRAPTGVPSIQRVDLASGGVDVLYDSVEGRPLVAPNDLVFDTTGGFWFTDYRGDAIHYARADGSEARCELRHILSPNGIGLSPAGDVLYWAQTATRQLHRRRLRGPGSVIASPRHEVATLLAGREPDPWTLVVGLPGRSELDSLAVEADGRVCIGTLLDGGITVVSPDDGTVETYTLPDGLADGAVTNVCFGGPDLRTAWLTCSVTGRLLTCRWARPGLRLAYQELA